MNFLESHPEHVKNFAIPDYDNKATRSKSVSVKRPAQSASIPPKKRCRMMDFKLSCDMVLPC